MRLAALDIPAQPEFVSIARLVVSSVAGDRYDLTDDQLESLKLAVSEACTLAIQAQNATDDFLTIECQGSVDRIDVVVDCPAGSFDGDAGQSQGVVDGTDFGREFGMPLVGSLVDEVTIETGEHRSRLRMTLFSELAEQL